jgi:23S rRNA (uracil1939-C5)-methyltransferase
VDVRLVKNKKDWAEGHPIAFHSYAAYRQQPFCEHFGTCGGCKWQMLPYAKQLEFKQQQVADQLQRIGHIPLPAIMPIIGGQEERYYRNKLEFTFANKRYITHDELVQLEGRPVTSETGFDGAFAGFHAPGVFDKVVDIKTCHLQHEPTNRIREMVKRYAIDRKIPFYDIKQHTGWLRTMQVRLCTTGELMVNIVVGMDKPEWMMPMLQQLMEQEPGITTLLFTINTKWNDSIHDLQPIVHHGPGYVIEQLGGYRFKIGPRSFFQTNTKQAEQLYRVTKEFAELDGTQTVYDLYCGTGSIGIYVSDRARKVIGVEMVEAAIEDAKENAALNNIHHALFTAGDVSDVCTDAFFDQHGRPDVIITDPPRAGMHEKLVKQILAMEAPTVVYVSCNPATQARDLKLLDEKYSVTKVQPVDMFPHTHHIENVVQLKRKV